MLEANQGGIRDKKRGGLTISGGIMRNAPYYGTTASNQSSKDIQIDTTPDIRTW